MKRFTSLCMCILAAWLIVWNEAGNVKSMKVGYCVYGNNGVWGHESRQAYDSKVSALLFVPYSSMLRIQQVK